GALSRGRPLVVMAELTQLYGPRQIITRKVAELQGSLASAERAFALLDHVPDVAERPDARPVARAAGAVTFRGVSFAYDRDHPVLHDISFEVKPGTRVG